MLFVDAATRANWRKWWDRNDIAIPKVKFSGLTFVCPKMMLWFLRFYRTNILMNMTDTSRTNHSGHTLAKML